MLANIITWSDSKALHAQLCTAEISITLLHPHPNTPQVQLRGKQPNDPGVAIPKHYNTKYQE